MMLRRAARLFFAFVLAALMVGLYFAGYVFQGVEPYLGLVADSRGHVFVMAVGATVAVGVLCFAVYRTLPHRSNHDQ